MSPCKIHPSRRTFPERRLRPELDRARTSLHAIALRFSAIPTTRAWWTGKDSNLRSPQGAADLQSAGFSHSPTRPVKPFGVQNPHPGKTIWDANYESRTYPSTTYRRTLQKHKKDSCQETPARSFFPAGFAPPSLPRKIFWWSWRRELNPRPSDYKSDALPAELRQRRSNRVRIPEEV